MAETKTSSTRPHSSIDIQPELCKLPKIGTPLSIKSALQLALKSAEKGVGFVSPNPPAGCVILDKDHKFLSEGHHKIFGGAHAERAALDKIPDKRQLKGAFVYVTLEPCAHFGKTPPCVKALARYPLKQVIYGMRDPNPKTAGAGIAELKAQGIEAKPFPCFQREIKNLYEVFSFNMREGKAWTALKAAVTLDGVTALTDGFSQWISSEASRKYVSRLRGRFDGVLIGEGAFLQDNPRLNPRFPPYKNKKNKAVILDPKGVCLKHIESSRLAAVRPLSHILVVTADRLKTPKNLPPFNLKKRPLNQTGHFDLPALLSDLYREEGIGSLLVEGGAGVYSSFLRQKSGVRLYQFISPKFFGGAGGRGLTEELFIETPSQAPVLKEGEIIKTGPDFLITGLFQHRTE